MTENELKPLLPCPFCDRQPESTAGVTSFGEPKHIIVCHCGCLNARAYQYATGKTAEDAFDEAARAWNTRNGGGE